MAETLGSLCDKLTVVKLKQFHSENPKHIESLAYQEKQLQDEINEFIHSAIVGDIPLDRLCFETNKVYKKPGNFVPEVIGSIGEVFSRLANVNCDLWHHQEHVYDFEKIPADKKDEIVKQLALLNLERNKCIDKIDKQFRAVAELYPNNC